MQNPGFKFEYFTKSIKYKGFNIETYVIGSGEKTILSLPSFPHSGLYYLWFLNHYDLNKVKFITFDLPGWIGISDNIFKDKPYSLDECVGILKEIVRSYNLKKFNLLGYSFGAALSVRLNHEIPGSIEKIALVSPVIECSTIRHTKEFRAVSLFKKLNLSFILGIYLRYNWWRYKPVMISQGMPTPLVSVYNAMLQLADPKVILNSIYSLFHTDWSIYLPDLENKKLLIVNSKQEGKMFRRQAEILRRRFGGQSIFSTGAHEDFILRPKSEVVKEVVKFLITE